MIDQGQHGVKPIPLLECRCCTFLIAVGGHHGGVQVDDHLVARTGQRSLTTPDALASSGPCGADRGESGIDIVGECGDQSGHGGIGGNPPEHLRLSPHHGDISSTVTAEGHRDGHIGEDLGRVVHRMRRSPRR